MVKKRPSLQSILIPSFIQYPTTPSPSSYSRPRAHSDASILPHMPVLPDNDSPPDFLLDDDPFANYSATRSLPPTPLPSNPVDDSARSQSKTRSPLVTDSHVRPHTSPSTPLPPSSVASSGAHPTSARQVRPAYTRPAFASRPSLPSLRALQHTQFVYPIKARRGTLGARLPLEPWDEPAGHEPAVLETSSLAADELHLSPSDDEPLYGNDDHTALVGWSLSPPQSPSRPLTAPDNFALYSAQSPISLEDTLDTALREPENRGTGVLSFYDSLPTLSSPESILTSSTSNAFSSYASSSESEPRQFGDSYSPHGSDSDWSASDSERSSEERIPLSPDNRLDDVLTPHSHAVDVLSYHISGSATRHTPSRHDFEPGTSASTIRAPISTILTERNSSLSSSEAEDDWRPSFDDESEYLESADDFCVSDSSPSGSGALMDADYRTDGQSTSRGRQQYVSQGGGGSGGSRRDRGNSDNNGGGGGGSAGGGQDGNSNGRDEDRFPTSKSTFSSDTESSEDEDKEEDGDEDEDGDGPKDTDAHRLDEQSTRQKRTILPHVDSTTDDDDIPLAQRIPTALRAQRTIRRQVRDENEERRRQRALKREQGRASTSEATVRRGTTLGGHRSSGGLTGDVPSQESQSMFQPTTRQRTKTLPNNAHPFAVDDLAKRLRSVQAISGDSSSSRRPLTSDSTPPVIDEFGRRSTEDTRGQHNSTGRGLRPMRSFHRPNVPETASPQTIPSVPVERLGHKATISSHSGRPRPSLDTNTELPPRAQTLDGPRRARSTRRPGDDGRPSTSSEHRLPTPSQAEPSSRDARLPVSWQQRIFVADMQRFNMLEIDATTNAKEVVHMLEQQRLLEGWAGVGGWMLYEVSQDFGMERPVRAFELVSDVTNSWDKDKSANVLLLKKTTLATLLHPSALPTSSPRCSGYVEWESKRGKWSKRWLELREHGLWLSKKDNGKDETFLCSLANFDGYQVTRLHKSPKPFVFAVKSTDNLTFFENTADYIHIFCCPEKDGQKWFEAILLARSYVINQERNVISNLPVSTSGSGKHIISRSGTRKGPRSGQPLVHVSGPISAAAINPTNVFEPGSLLANR
ncbi:hypothetical protein FA95DRAFT_1562262 [Auriscalpium vulgare]|uniref:Uncharacterized protein n=1 Tax=Auriscalpium vulgare TaxID=40419 RepID=A0ACB8RKT1_9AGAM|nr:hypothetical protein FA95DRAFT_1562262 [Auriscalpium vulgare]